MTLEGYSPFKTANANDPVLTEIARRHGVTTHQVILRWHIDHGFVVIPKSSNPERIVSNFDVFGFELTPTSSHASTASAAESTRAQCRVRLRSE